MAIKFRDNAPQDEAQARKDAAATAKAAAPQPDPGHDDIGAPDSATLAKPEPKKRGRKKAFG